MARVIVVGAGFAGLAAADVLARAGHELIVLEARDRVGGRVWSDRLANGGLIERGAEFITAGYDTTETYAARLGLALDGMGIRYPDRELAPDPGIDRAALEAAADEVEEAAGLAPDEPAVALLARVVTNAAIRELLAARTQSARAFPIERLPASSLAHVSHLLRTEETRRVRGGNDLIARGLAADLGRSLHLSAAATRIAHDERGVSVTTADSVVAADACVVAVPVAVLVGLAFDPPLPAPLAAAIAATPTGTAAKLAVGLAKPAPSRAVMSVAHRFWAYATPCDEVGGRVLGSWAGSAPVVEALAAETGATAWLARVEELWPGLAIDPRSATVTVWRRGPWDGGAYSVLAPAERDVRGPLEGPLGRLAFAGEHTARDWAATMEGALRSGERAAADVGALLAGPGG